MDITQTPIAPEDVTPLDYQPTEEQQKRVSQVKKAYTQYRQDRQTHEKQWFANAAMARSQQNIDFNRRDRLLGTIPDAPSHRIRFPVNKILPKLRARRSKFLRTRPTWVVVPASPDQEDKMNARATQKALDYQWRRLKLELAHIEVTLWAEVCGRGYWWIHWDPSVKSRIGVPNELTGQTEYSEAELGDVDIEVGTPFELLVADVGKVRIGDQPEIIRARLRKVEEVKVRYPALAGYIKAGEDVEDLFRYEKQISGLNASGYGMTPAGKKDKDEKDKVLVLELFQRPTPDCPKGRYTVIAGDVLLKDEKELPYGFGDMRNPFPVVEFIDMPLAGQYYGTTLIEQLAGIQRNFNLLISKLVEQTRGNAHPKMLVALQHQVKKGANTSEPAEVIEYVARPGLPPPQYLVPPPISADVWRLLAEFKTEFEDISQIFPATEGKVGTATSGFQTNLLQEAADSVHMPDMRLHEMAIEEAAYKIRRLMKEGYDIPRIITAIGREYEPDVFEFSKEEIDENANIIVESGSGLPQTKFARIEAVRGMFKDGLLGPPDDPETRRRAMAMMEFGSVEESYDLARRDIDRARIENAAFATGQAPQPPMFYDNHQVHYSFHTDQLKAPETDRWDPKMKMALIAHVIKHAEFINPQSAAQLAIEFGMPQILKPSTVQAFQQQEMLKQQALQAGAPPQGAPPQQATPPPQAG